MQSNNMYYRYHIDEKGNVIDDCFCVAATPEEYNLAYRANAPYGGEFFVVGEDGRRIKDDDGYYMIVDMFDAQDAITYDAPAGFKYARADAVRVMDDFGCGIGTMGDLFAYRDDDVSVSMAEVFYAMKWGMYLANAEFRTLLSSGVLDLTIPSGDVCTLSDGEVVRVNSVNSRPDREEVVKLSHDVAIAHFLWANMMEYGIYYGTVADDTDEPAVDENTHDEAPGDDDAGEADPVSWAAQGVHDYIMMGAIASIYGMAATDGCQSPVITRAIDACTVFQANYHVMPKDNTRRLFALGILGIIMELPEEYMFHVNAYEEAFNANNW